MNREVFGNGDTFVTDLYTVYSLGKWVGLSNTNTLFLITMTKITYELEDTFCLFVFTFLHINLVQ